MDQDRYREQQKEANYKFLEFFAMIGCAILAGQRARDFSYNPWLMIAGLGLTFVSCVYPRSLRNRGVKLSHRQRFISTVGIALGLGWSFGMFFGIFR